MYPIIRMSKELVKFRKASPLALTEAHVSQHMCMPWDIDMWLELNNGRALTLYDLGRVPLATRTGLAQTLKARGWGMTIAGNTTRYRRRVRAFDKFEMVSRCIGWDERFIYMDQSMWRNGDCTSQLITRSAVTDARGMVPVAKVLEAMGHTGTSPEFPDWIKDWVATETKRIWPPAR